MCGKNNFKKVCKTMVMRVRHSPDKIMVKGV